MWKRRRPLPRPAITNARQLNMTAVLVLGLPFSVEPGAPEIMHRPPRDPARPLLTRDLVGRILLVSAILLAGAFGLFHWEQATGVSLDTAPR